jgi:hypothetical protein
MFRNNIPGVQSRNNITRFNLVPYGILSHYSVIRLIMQTYIKIHID